MEWLLSNWSKLRGSVCSDGSYGGCGGSARGACHWLSNMWFAGGWCKGHRPQSGGTIQIIRRSVPRPDSRWVGNSIYRIGDILFFQPILAFLFNFLRVSQSGNFSFSNKKKKNEKQNISMFHCENSFDIFSWIKYYDLFFLLQGITKCSWYRW